MICEDDCCLVFFVEYVGSEDDVNDNDDNDDLLITCVSCKLLCHKVFQFPLISKLQKEDNYYFILIYLHQVRFLK